MENNIINQFIKNINNKKTTEQILNQYQKIREDYKKTQKFFNNNFLLIIEALKKTIKLTTK